MSSLSPGLVLIHHLLGLGLDQVVVCPGSRSAPLVLALSRLPGLMGLPSGVPSITVAGDERSAGYQALGMAVATGRPVALITTSGTAALNLHPALAEALLTDIPLLALTADRPPEWQGHQDGQMVADQAKALATAVRMAAQLPDTIARPGQLWQIRHTAGAAWQILTGPRPGPVHLNVPLTEPLYPAAGAPWPNEALMATLKAEPAPYRVLSAPARLERGQIAPLYEQWRAARRRLIIVGQHPYDPALRDALRALLTYDPDTALYADIVSNVHDLEQTGGGAGPGPGHRSRGPALPLWLGPAGSPPPGNLPEPDLILHVGGSILARGLRAWLAARPAVQVWRVQPTADTPPDPLMGLSRVIVATPATLIERLGELTFVGALDATGPAAGALAPAFEQLMTAQVQRTREALADTPWGEGQAVAAFLAALDRWHGAAGMAGPRAHLHLASSMPVRWAALMADLPGWLRVYATRGASGIDGPLSAAVGYARATPPDEPVYLITGEGAALYDRNALWATTYSPLPQNLRIIVLNNRGGGIFGLIDGPSGHPEAGPFFVAPHRHTLEGTARSAGLTYLGAYDASSLDDALQQGFAPGHPGPVLIEVFSDLEAGRALYRAITGHSA